MLTDEIKDSGPVFHKTDSVMVFGSQESGLLVSVEGKAASGDLIDALAVALNNPRVNEVVTEACRLYLAGRQQPQD